MSNQQDLLTIVMYHYVRPIKKSDFPNIKGLELDDFIGQLDYIEEHYTPIAIEDLVQNPQNLPKRPILLTFDDGYIDHFKYAFPELKKRKLRGCFYVPAGVIDGNMLDVNVIHFLLEACKDHDELIQMIDTFVEENKQSLGLLDLSDCKDQYFRANRYDPKEINYIKRMLQHALPPTQRHRLAETLFQHVKGVSSREFSKQLYMSKQQLNEMIEGGMHIGGHTVSHVWLGKVDEETQKQEIAGSRAFLDTLLPQKVQSFCYPYGNYNDISIRELKKQNFQAAFTTKVELADPTEHSSYELPRLDTNDLPRERYATPVAFTKVLY